MKPISENTCAFFLKYAEKTLNGRWVLLGGALLPVLGINVRITTDIDLVPLDHSGNHTLMQSFDLAENLKIPVETINSAALFFLKKIPNFEQELISLKKWKNA